MKLLRRIADKYGRFIISINLFKLPIIGKKIEIFFAGGENAEQTKPKKELPKEYTEVFKQMGVVLNEITRK